MGKMKDSAKRVAELMCRVPSAECPGMKWGKEE